MCLTLESASRSWSRRLTSPATHRMPIERHTDNTALHQHPGTPAAELAQQGRTPRVCLLSPLGLETTPGWPWTWGKNLLPGGCPEQSTSPACPSPRGPSGGGAQKSRCGHSVQGGGQSRSAALGTAGEAGAQNRRPLSALGPHGTQGIFPACRCVSLPASKSRHASRQSSLVVYAPVYRWSAFKSTARPTPCSRHTDADGNKPLLPCVRFEWGPQQ